MKDCTTKLLKEKRLKEAIFLWDKGWGVVGEFLHVIIGIMEDSRNLIDEYKGLANEEVKNRLAEKRNTLEVAIENVSHDFNAGTIVRSANNFNAAKIHIVGRRKYNRRGAMCTDKYLEICYWPDLESFFRDQRERGREVVAIENNVERAKGLSDKQFKAETTLVFGSEGDGLSEECLREPSRSNDFCGADDVRYIESFGSTRSINVGVAAGIAMYEWARQVVLKNK